MALQTGDRNRKSTADFAVRLDPFSRRSLSSKQSFFWVCDSLRVGTEASTRFVKQG